MQLKSENMHSDDLAYVFISALHDFTLTNEEITKYINWYYNSNCNTLNKEQINNYRLKHPYKYPYNNASVKIGDTCLHFSGNLIEVLKLKHGVEPLKKEISSVKGLITRYSNILSEKRKDLHELFSSWTIELESNQDYINKLILLTQNVKDYELKIEQLKKQRDILCEHAKI